MHLLQKQHGPSRPARQRQDFNGEIMKLRKLNSIIRIDRCTFDLIRRKNATALRAFFHNPLFNTTFTAHCDLHPMNYRIVLRRDAVD